MSGVVSSPILALPYPVVMPQALVMPQKLGGAEAISESQLEHADAAPDAEVPRMLEVAVCCPTVGRLQPPEGRLDSPGGSRRPFILLSGCHIKLDYSLPCPYMQKIPVTPSCVTLAAWPRRNAAWHRCP